MKYVVYRNERPFRKGYKKGVYVGVNKKKKLRSQACKILTNVGKIKQFGH